MALNCAHADGGVLIHYGECILLYSDGVEMHFDGNDEPSFKGSKKGRLYLTSHRVIFNNKDGKDRLQSFSMPFFGMTSVELEQPVFGSNYIRGMAKAQSGGNFEGNVKFKIYFKEGGAIEYGQAMLEAARLASRYQAHVPPPPYFPPSGPFYPAPPPAYMPPPGNFYGFVPPSHAFPNAPPANGVYMMEQPPPYPGIQGGAPPPYPPPSSQPYSAGFGQQPPYPQASAPYPPTSANGHMSSADAKAMEAAQSAYYNPANPHQTYMPPPMDQMPPPYSEATKKND